MKPAERTRKEVEEGGLFYAEHDMKSCNAKEGNVVIKKNR